MNKSEYNVPKKIEDDKIFNGNMIIESEIDSINENHIEIKGEQNNPNIINSNSMNSNTIPSSTKTKNKQKNTSKLKGDSSNCIRCKLKKHICKRNSLKMPKYKYELNIDELKKLSINPKNSQSNESFDDEIKNKLTNIKSERNLPIKGKNNFINDNEMQIDNNSSSNTQKNENNNNIINYEINIEYLNVNNKIKEIKNPPLTSISFKEFKTNLPHFEYFNDIWESFIQRESINNYSYKDIISIQTDIKESMRCILIDWIISLQNKFFKKIDTFFLTINLIDRFLSKKPILRTRFQLLGVSSLFIAIKYEEIYMKNINDFVELTARAFDKSEILEMEKTIIDLVEFNLDLPLSHDFFGLLSTVFKFDEKEYIFGCFLLEAFLLDITCCEYKQSQIALATIFIVLGLRQMKRINPIEGNNFIKFYCNEYKVNFDIWKDYDIIVNCAKKIYFFFEHREKVIYKEVYKLHNFLFI